MGNMNQKFSRQLTEDIVRIEKNSNWRDNRSITTCPAVMQINGILLFMPDSFAIIKISENMLNVKKTEIKSYTKKIVKRCITIKAIRYMTNFTHNIYNMADNA